MRLADPKPGLPATVEVIRTDEKGSDVNLASHLLLDGFLKTYSTAVVISNDSDLRVPIRIAINELGLRVGVINPHPPEFRSRALRADFFKQLRKGILSDCQLPEVLADEHGEFRRPTEWSR